VSFGRVAALGTATSIDTLTIRHDRAVPFDPGVLAMRPTATSLLAVFVETANAASREIGPAGGDVTATGASGYSFHLAVPADVSANATVSVTPISRIDGFVFGPGVLAAARLEPAGIEFSRPATLTVTAPGGAPLPDSVVAFHFSPTGVELVPLSLQGGAVAVPVSQFSDWVIVDVAGIPVAATKVAQASFDSFLEWTQKYLEGFATGDWGYFADPNHRAFPQCSGARSVINEALGLCRMMDVIGGSACNAVLERLEEVLALMMDGRLVGANVICASDSQDDTAFLQCQAAIESANERAGLEIGLVGKTCGAQRIVADPTAVFMDSGDSATIDFSVLDASSQPILGRGVKVLDMSLGDVVDLSIPDVGPVVVTCTGVGSGQIRAWDATAFDLGVRDDLVVDVPVFCSPAGLVLRPASPIRIAGDAVELQVSVLDAAGNAYPAEVGIDFSWSSYGQAYVVVTPHALDPSAATVQTFDGQIGTATVVACLGELYPCDVRASIEVKVVPNLRGTWYGSGWQTAESCTDPEDDGTYAFDDWVAVFTQSLDPQIAPFSDFSAQLSGSGIGDYIQGPLEGTMSDAGAIAGSALYSSGTAGGSATFQGYRSSSAISLDYSYRDSFGDSCRGTGSVTFRRTPP
jgi:hypothetical protein